MVVVADVAAGGAPAIRHRDAGCVRCQADSRADATGLRLWRQWSLAGACAAIIACGTLFVFRPAPETQILPVPVLEDLGLPSPPQS